MKVAFFSNFLNHHQLPLCLELSKRENVQFVFVATEPVEQERLDMGYADMNKEYDFVLRAYESEENFRKAERLAVDCDVMIFGAAPLSYLEKRMEEGKTTFYFSERILRKGYWRRFIPTTYKKIYNAYLRYKNKPLYILAASAYASYDLKLCGFNEKKCYKWGYFPEIAMDEAQELLRKKQDNQKVEILYAGRLLKIKNVLDTVKAIDLLVQEKVDNVHFTIVGEGEQKQEIENYIQKKKLQEYVTLLPFKKHNEIKEYMAKADIYVFSSNHYEGWGAVVNEAMASACAMAVSHAAGSVPYLIQNEKNGLIYQCGNVKELAHLLKKVIGDKSYRERLAIEAHDTITKKWTVEIAVDRLLGLYTYLKNDCTEDSPYDNGICSLAELIENNWINKKK